MLLQRGNWVQCLMVPNNRLHLFLSVMDVPVNQAFQRSSEGGHQGACMSQEKTARDWFESKDNSLFWSVLHLWCLTSCRHHLRHWQDQDLLSRTLLRNDTDGRTSHPKHTCSTAPRPDSAPPALTAVSLLHPMLTPVGSEISTIRWVTNSGIGACPSAEFQT